MSDAMLKGILNMPLPEQPEDCDVVTWMQFKAAARQAADRIEELGANIDIKADFIDATLNQLAASEQHIEELEAKLAAFLQFLDENYRHAFGDTARQKIRELYAELKGEDRG